MISRVSQLNIIILLFEESDIWWREALKRYLGQALPHETVPDQPIT